jgi:glycosyltransferase involved in cell wall biosynthesis
MKIYILFEFKKGPWGGGNQFLKALKNKFKEKGLYTENYAEADIILFNSHHNLYQLLKLKRKFFKKKFVHRIDGPLFLIRGGDLFMDKIIFKISNKIADLSIFQSKWSLDKSKNFGFLNKYKSIIYNAPDNLIFNTKNKNSFKKNGKVRIIATSWSGNWNKGFDVYKYLDENLDFNKYDFVFVGNSPYKFKNSTHLNPLSSEKLAQELKKSDIYITASKNDPCSNSLIEALSCGLPAIVYNDGGHPELIKKGGEVFNKKEELLPGIEKISNNYSKYKKRIPKYKIEDISKRYISVFKHIDNNDLKKISLYTFFYFILLLFFNKIKSTLNKK